MDPRRTCKLTGIAVLFLFFAQKVLSAGPVTTLTTLDAATGTIPAGKPLQLTARVSSASGVAAGSITFYDGATPLGTAKLNDLALAGISTSTLTVGSHSLTAVYAGSSSFVASASDAVAVTVTPAPAGATTIKVPSQKSTIQAAIDAAKNGDTVLVAPGAYKENINFKGKNIVVTSESGPERTIVDGGNKTAVAKFVHGEKPAAVLNGFTLLNGSGSYSAYDPASGIEINNSSPSILPSKYSLKEPIQGELFFSSPDFPETYFS